MSGRIIQVSVSPGGIPKRALKTAVITTQGIEGDSWAHPQFHGGVNQALLIIASEAINELRIAGFPLFPGALGENLTTAGLDPHGWRIGQVYRVGSAKLELTKIRVPCRTIQIYGTAISAAIYDAEVKGGDTNSPRWGYSGIYARVLTEGVVKTGDSVELESDAA